eukprot:TRINITY_DN92729_c0_g1_i1.p1 TRINITY_DN92729_c0_g1~~TRINITY_DN92729_c0_g1_i1.p1  ORF type:complete len:199 (+),score=51.87 TRINITY_DN92729_c0_g1_i1:63-659(+)
MSPSKRWFGLRPASPMMLAILCSVKSEVGLASASKDSPAMKMLMCDACRQVVQELGKDVKYLVESDKMWKPKDLSERIALSCGDPMLASGAMKEACGFLVSDFQKRMEHEIALRWTEESEKFEEDIVPREVCTDIGACNNGHKTLNEMIGESDRKEKALKWEKEEKEKSAAAKKKAAAKGASKKSAGGDTDEIDDADL